MKFCSTCGAQLSDTAAFCTSCGSKIPVEDNVTVDAGVETYVATPDPVAAYPETSVPYADYPVSDMYVAPAKTPSGLSIAAKILMIISTVVMGIYIIPLAWCLPMTISYCKKIKNGIPVSTGFKVCCLLFVNTLAGIFMLCDKNN